jgi:hypothetical protein
MPTPPASTTKNVTIQQGSSKVKQYKIVRLISTYTKFFIYVYLCVKAKLAGERFSIVGRDGHVLARTDLADVGRKVNGEPLMSSKAE